MILHTSDNKYPNSFFFESNETKSLYFYHLCLSVCIHHQNCFLLWVIGFTFSQTWKKIEIHKTFTMLSCLLLEEKLSNQLHILELCFYKKIAHHTLCTANVHSTEYIMVWHQIKKSSWLSIFQLNSSKKKAQKIMKVTFFSEKYRKAMFVFIKKAGRGQIEILDKLSSYAILSKGAIFHCSISKKKANSCLPAVIGVLFNWTILSFWKCKNKTYSTSL